MRAPTSPRARARPRGDAKKNAPPCRSGSPPFVALLSAGVPPGDDPRRESIDVPSLGDAKDLALRYADIVGDIEMDARALS